MSEFEDNLWRDVVRQHGDDLAQVPWPPPHHRRPRRGLLAGTTFVAAAAVAVLALVLGGTSTSPAYAVNTNHDGSITLTINRLNGIHGANVRLSSLGVRAVAIQVPAACRAALAVARFDPRRIPVGKTLVIAAWRAGHSIRLSSARISQAGAPACLAPGKRWTAIPGSPPIPGATAQCKVSGPAALPPGALVPAGSGTGTGTGTASGTSTATGTSTAASTAATASGATGTETTQTPATATGTTPQTGTGTSGQTGTGTGTGTAPAPALPPRTVSIPCGYRQVVVRPAEIQRRVLALTRAARRKFAAACRAAPRSPSPQTATVPGSQHAMPPTVTIVRCRPASSK
jgi:hypothetical protein